VTKHGGVAAHDDSEFAALQAAHVSVHVSD
jgi:hypothetical protein